MAVDAPMVISGAITIVEINSTMDRVALVETIMAMEVPDATTTATEDIAIEAITTEEITTAGAAACLRSTKSSTKTTLIPTQTIASTTSAIPSFLARQSTRSRRHSILRFTCSAATTASRLKRRESTTTVAKTA